MRKGITVGLLMLSLSAVLYGCATTLPQEKAIVYPSFPEDPKLAYLRSYTGPTDFRKPGIFDAIFGVPTGSLFQKPYGVTAYSDKIYVADGPSGVVFIVDRKAKSFDVLSGSDAGKLAHPIGVAAASDGTIYVTDARIKQVFGYDDKGEFKIAIGKKDDFKTIAGLAVNDALGRIYVADSYAHDVRVYSVKGEPLFTFGTFGEGDGEFRYPTNIAIDRKNGNVYVVDTQNFRVQVFDKDGKFIKKFGELGDTPGSFSRPKGIGIDSEGHVYVVDAAFDNIQIFNEEGRLLLFFGGAGSGPGQFSLPAGLYIDEKDMIYVVDSLNQRVSVYQYLSEKWKKENPEEYKKYLSKPEPKKK